MINFESHKSLFKKKKIIKMDIKFLDFYATNFVRM